MNKWIKVDDGLPQNGDIVNIKITGDQIRKKVLFEDGVFWKLRKARNVGQCWLVSEWQAIDKKVGRKSGYENTALGEHEER